MSTEEICDRADVMMHLLFPTAGSTKVCAMFSGRGVLFNGTITLPNVPQQAPARVHCCFTHPGIDAQAQRALASYPHASLRSLAIFPCDEPQSSLSLPVRPARLADKKVRKMKRDAKAATRKRMAARRKEKRRKT